jgi:hypothetical protein
MADQSKDDKSKDNILYTRSREFIDLLRKEASDAKSCVTQYSFQSLTISGLALSFIVSSSKDDPRSIATIAAIPMILILMVMMRIAVYKYEIANRAYGYELYLKTMLNISEDIDNSKKPILKDCVLKEDVKHWKFIVEREDWERTYLVWKVVYPTLFSFYYHINFYDKVANFIDTEAYNLRRSHLDLIKKKEKRSTWLLGGRKFDIKTGRFVPQHKKPADFHAGGYLTKILDVILTMQLFLAMPLFFSFSNLVKELLKNLNASKKNSMYNFIHDYSIAKGITIDNYSIIGGITIIFFIITILCFIAVASVSYFRDTKLKIESLIMNCINLMKKVIKIKLLIFIMCSSIVVGLFIIQFHQSLPDEWKMIISLINATTGIIFTILFSCIMTVRIKRREKILETGINSIRSSSLI